MNSQLTFIPFGDLPLRDKGKEQTQYIYWVTNKNHENGGMKDDYKIKASKTPLTQKHKLNTITFGKLSVNMCLR